MEVALGGSAAESESNQTNDGRFFAVVFCSGIDRALLKLWSFIVGVAERFVPDNLMRLVRQQTDETTL